MSNSPARILFVHNSADIYGASRVLLRLCGALDQARFEPVVLLPEDGPLVQRLKDSGIALVTQPRLSVITRRVFKSWRLVPFLLNIPLAAWQLRSIIRRHRIDLVHTNVGTILSSALSTRMAGVPHVWHIRDWYGEFRGLWKWYRRYVFACSEMVVCVSRAIADQFPRAPKLVIVHDGFPIEEFAVDQARLRAEFREKYHIAPNSFVVSCIGRIKFVRKGQEFLVKAAAILREKNVDLMVLIVGAPSPGSENHLPRLRTLVDKLGLQDRVVFTGELPDTRPAYAASDVFVLPSAQPEPFGGVVLEAMCMGKPVIATAVGGSLDQVVDGQTGYLVPPADPRALGEKILILFRDPVLRKQMGNAGAERVRTHFNLQRMVKRLEEIYLRVLAQ